MFHKAEMVHRGVVLVEYKDKSLFNLARLALRQQRHLAATPSETPVSCTAPPRCFVGCSSLSFFNKRHILHQVHTTFCISVIDVRQKCTRRATAIFALEQLHSRQHFAVPSSYKRKLVT